MHDLGSSDCICSLYDISYFVSWACATSVHCWC